MASVSEDLRKKLIIEAERNGITKKEMARIIYCTTPKTFRRWMQRHFDATESLNKPYRFKVFTPAEVQEIFKRLGKPKL